MGNNPPHLVFDHCFLVLFLLPLQPCLKKWGFFFLKKRMYNQICNGKPGRYM
jgi:hypothetical protein